MFKLSNVQKNQDVISYISDQGGFPNNSEQSLENFKFYEFNLKELNLPPSSEILKSVLAIKNQVGLQGWRKENTESKFYKGFSLTYNPDFFDNTQSVYHQSWGSNLLTQNFGRPNGLGNHSFIKNTYYDSYGFRKIPEIVEKNLKDVLSKFSSSLVRSRAAFLNLYGVDPGNSGWHVDEPPYHLFRINIPLQTSKEHILEIKGTDEFGNSLELSKHLELEKAYIWNTRIPHRVTVNKPSQSNQDRIHLVLGFSPWFKYISKGDCYIKSEIYGLPMEEIISRCLFLDN
jgi:hypothetical protein